MSTDFRKAKQPISKIAGPYGHPFHPVLVTVPIGAWVASFVFDVLSYMAGEPDPFVTGARWLIGIGIAGALAAAIFGFLDFLQIPSGTKAFRTAITHLALNVLVVLIFAGALGARLGQRIDEPAPFLLVGVSVIALLLLSASGWLGGRLAYRYGVRVADESTQAEGYGGRPGDHDEAT